MASRNINRVLLTGNLTRDPELKSTPGGASVCEFSIALNSREKRGEEWVDRVDYVDIVAWGRDAENVVEYLGKGRPVAIDGRLRHERWETKGGDKRSRHRVVADRVQFLSSGDGERRAQSDFEPPASDLDAPADGGDFAQPAATAADDDIPF